MSKIIYIDTETTGLDPVKHDIVQLAFIVEIDGKVVDEQEFKIRPHNINCYEQQALDVHGFSLDVIKEFPSAKEVLKRVQRIWSTYVNKYDKTDKFIACGQRVDFDLNFLNQWFKKGGDQYFWSWIQGHKIDLVPISFFMQIAGQTATTKNLKLETVCKSLGVCIQAHDALSDIRATRECFKKYLKIVQQRKLIVKGGSRRCSSNL